MHSLFLKPNDKIEVIAPASKFNPKILKHVDRLIQSWNLEGKISCPMNKTEWLCSTSIEERFKVLQDALMDLTSKAIWILRGGYGCSQLLPYLDQLPIPPFTKLLMGFSDTTALHLFVNKKWNWPSLHCPATQQVAMNTICKKSKTLLKDFIFGNLQPYCLELIPRNQHCSEIVPGFSTRVLGGNLSLVISSLATFWQIQAENQFLFLEETGEAAYRIDRMLNQLLQAKILTKIKGLIFGEFIQKDSKSTDDQTKCLLDEWAARLPIPVFSCPAGHAKQNYPIPLNCLARFYFSPNPHLVF